MEIPKDIYEYLTNFADDKTILKMLETNKKYSDPLFFEKIITRKYPELLKYKKLEPNANLTMKQYYIKMIYYIGKLQDKYQINYDLIKGKYPEQVYNITKLVKAHIYQFKHFPGVYDADEKGIILYPELWILGLSFVYIITKNINKYFLTIDAKDGLIKESEEFNLNDLYKLLITEEENIRGIMLYDTGGVAVIDTDVNKWYYHLDNKYYWW